MKKTPLKRKTKLRQKTPIKRTNKKTVRKKTKRKGFVTPTWFNKIPYGSHGSNAAQKRFWKLVSDTYRRADFYKYKGRCVSCSAVLEDWKDGDLAHFKRYSVCNSYFKYERKNVALSCKGCNRNDDGVVGYHFGEELKRRWGDDVIAWIERENLKYRGQKIETHTLVDMAAKLRPELVE